jgi:hypothetical protein
MAPQLREHIIKRRQELANSWSFWNNMWSWVPWVLPLIGPLFMLLLALLFVPCIINVLSKFISQQVQKIKFQLLVKNYSPLLTHEPSVEFSWRTWRPHWSTPETSAPIPPLPLPPHFLQESARSVIIPFPHQQLGACLRGGTCWGIRRQNEPVPPSPMRAPWALHPVKGQAVSQVMALWLCLKMPRG